MKLKIEKGFTLIELVMSILIFSVGINAMIPMAGEMMRQSSLDAISDRSRMLAEQEFERVTGLAFASVANEPLTNFTGDFAAYSYQIQMSYLNADLTASVPATDYKRVDITVNHPQVPAIQLSTMVTAKQGGLPNGLLAYFPLNSTYLSGGNYYTSEMAASNNGRLFFSQGTPPYTAAGRIDNAIDFPLSGYVDTSNPVYWFWVATGANHIETTAQNASYSSPAFTIALWINHTIPEVWLNPATWWNLFSNGNSSLNSNFSLRLARLDTTTGGPLQPFAVFYVRDAGGSWLACPNNYTAGNVKLPGSQWHHLAAVFDGASNPTGKIYINGGSTIVSCYASTFASSIGSGSRPLNIGGRAFTADTDNYFQGRMDEVRYYNRVLSSAEIADLYTNGGGGGTTTSVQPNSWDGQ